MIHRLSNWERTVIRRLALPKESRWRWLPSLGAHLGDGALWGVVGSGLLIWGTPFLRRLTLIAALAVLGATVISTAIKYLVCRPRPQELSQFYSSKYDRYAFPSGHATRMGAIAVVVGHYVPWLAPVSYALALLVAMCRVMVGVHYPSDVLGGLLIGFTSAVCVLLFI